MNRLFIILFILVVFNITFFTGFQRFYLSIKNYQITYNKNIQGIAVLTGGKGRISEGLEVFKSYKDIYLLISGVDKSIKIEEILPANLLNNQKVFTDTISETTRDNAIAIIKWAKKYNIRHIKIITSDYHMPRSMIVLSKNTKNLSFYAHPVKSNIDIMLGDLKSLNKLNFLMKEYFKYLLSLIIY
ncbi:MAG: YdcF family protein [Pseudomonadota bacterium]|nr:YdcF family protein [Pseudomonadota bacterium]